MLRRYRSPRDRTYVCLPCKRRNIRSRKKGPVPAMIRNAITAALQYPEPGSPACPVPFPERNFRNPGTRILPDHSCRKSPDRFPEKSRGESPEKNSGFFRFFSLFFSGKFFRVFFRIFRDIYYGFIPAVFSAPDPDRIRSRPAPRVHEPYHMQKNFNVRANAFLAFFFVVVSVFSVSLHRKTNRTNI